MCESIKPMRGIGWVDGAGLRVAMRALHCVGVLNIHHLELFYYVARHGGISRAVRKIPYGIQQPAISGQILQLEEALGAQLFVRSPFRLTPMGTELYAFVQPFFENLEAMEGKLRVRATPVLRIGAAEMALRDHLPAVFARLRARVPGLRLTLRSGFQAELEAWLAEGTIDFAVAPLDRRPAKRIRAQPLLKVPLVLQVPRASRWRTAAELWRGGAAMEPLIALPETESVVRKFRQGLSREGVEWPTAIEASSLDAVTAYVAAGHGVGVNVQLPDGVRMPGVRILPLEGFAPLEIAALWTGTPGPLVVAWLEEARAYVCQTWPELAGR